MNYRIKKNENLTIHWDFCEWLVKSIYVEQNEIISLCAKYKDHFENKWVHQDDIDINELDYKSICKLQKYIEGRKRR